MGPGRAFIQFAAAAVLLAGSGLAGAVVVRDAEGLIAAIENRETLIEAEGTIEFQRRYDGTNNALPVIDYRVVEIRGREGAELRATRSGFRLAGVIGIGKLILEDITIRGFSTGAPGGAVHVDDADLELERVEFLGNHSGLSGGALHVQGDFPDVEVTDTHFEGNSAGQRGGAVSIVGKKTAGVAAFRRSRLVDNEAPVGCAVSAKRSERILFADTLVRGECQQALLDADDGRLGFDFYRTTWLAGPGRVFRFAAREASEPQQMWLAGNVFVRTSGPPEPLCFGEVSGEPEFPAYRSFGFNVATDDSCGHDPAVDLLVDEAAEVLDGTVPIEKGPAVEGFARPWDIQGGDFLSCAVADANGLGRPQDGDADGVSYCDSGAVEAQRGPDIGPAQSGAYYDPERSGEGYFVEILEDGRAWVTFFTFTPIGSSPDLRDSYPAWFTGVGRVVGNSVVLSDFQALFGGRFGDAFDPGAILVSGGAELSLVFPGCSAGPGNPGTSYFRTGQRFGDADLALYTDVFAEAVRLSSIVGCDGEAKAANSGRSGSFYAPARSGEGIQVQWLPDGRVLAAWYTFDLNRHQLWMISESSQVDGDTVTLSMVYPATPTAFGPAFDPEDIELETWGTLTLEYTDCDTVELSYDSEIEGYGSGSYTYQRLTQPAGTSCGSQPARR